MTFLVMKVKQFELFLSFSQHGKVFVVSHNLLNDVKHLLIYFLLISFDIKIGIICLHRSNLHFVTI